MSPVVPWSQIAGTDDPVRFVTIQHGAGGTQSGPIPPAQLNSGGPMRLRATRLLRQVVPTSNRRAFPRPTSGVGRRFCGVGGVFRPGLTCRDAPQDFARLRDTLTADFAGSLVDTPVGFWCGARQQAQLYCRASVLRLVSHA